MKLRLFRLTPIILILILLVTVLASGNAQAGGPVTNPLDPAAGDIYIPILLTPRVLDLAPRINAPFIDAPFLRDWTLSRTAVAWFGKVTLAQNYADVRIAYNTQELFVDLEIMDRRTWYSTNPTPSDLTAWDAATLYIKLDGNTGNAPDASSYRFIGQLSDLGLNRASYQQAARGTGSGWNIAALPFTTEAYGRGTGGNNTDIDEKGWILSYHIPFSSLGLGGRPADGTTWGLGLVLHDRDSAAGPPLPDQYWPKTLDESRPATWGKLGFGLPAYNPPPSTSAGITTIRNKLNGAVVKDAGVGGWTTCGTAAAPNYFPTWGDLNFSAYGAEALTKVNVQNQADLSDWPCFSKFYITFPLDSLPPGKVIRSATLTLFQFGNSDPNQALSTLMQVLTVADDWDEASLTWNNAPYAWENVSQSWVDALPANYPAVPGAVRTWDVGRAVAEAYQKGIPLRLVLYSADGPPHSGKYFYSSDVDDYMPTSRPTLTVDWGN